VLAGRKMAVYENNNEDPHILVPDEDDLSDVEQEEITPDDLVVLCGRTENKDDSRMEVYVYDNENASLYVHHDFILQSFPLSVAWMTQDPRFEPDAKTQVCSVLCSASPSIYTHTILHSYHSFYTHAYAYAHTHTHPHTHPHTDLPRFREAGQFRSHRHVRHRHRDLEPGRHGCTCVYVYAYVSLL
jgi:hypothetical protein